MNKRQNTSARASALQITLSVALVAVSAILSASSFRAAPQAAFDGFYPPLPGQKTTEGGCPTLPITLSLPNDFLDPSVPASTVIIAPVTTTMIDSATTNGANITGCQGDFTFDSSVITFASPFVQRAGLTSDPNWNVSANIIGTGTIKTLRISAFMGSLVGLNGSGTCF